jgi:RES domain-containing protein
VSLFIELWRIAADTPDYEAHDLSGKGAEKTGGRWNQKGTAMVYASGSRSLACLETVVHLSGGIPLPLNRFLVQLRLPWGDWKARTTFKPAENVGWNAEPAGKVSIGWGDAWAKANDTLVAEVPSVIVPEEANILINPAHPDIGKVKATKVRKWTYDFRLK